MFDWFTFAAQIANFVILAVILKFVLYDRVVKAMDARQQRIADRLNEARDKEAQAEKQREEYRRKSREIDEKRDQLLEAARHDAEQRRTELEDAAREEADKRRKQWIDAIEQQRSSFLQDLRQQTSRRVCEISRHALRDLADAELEQQVIGAFLRRLGELDDEQTKAIADALAEGGETVTVRTAWEPDEEQRKALGKAVTKRLGHDGDVQFEQAEQLICGVQLKAGGQAVGWSVEQYVEDLAESIDAALSEQSHRAVKEQEQAEQQEAEDAADEPESGQDEGPS
jgi:F-type H+-transporting ATPase subunit b